METLKSKIIKDFELDDNITMSSEDINALCIELVALRDEDRIRGIGYILLHLITNIEEEPPQSIDLFCLSIYPYIYPRIEEWEELKISTEENSYDRKIQEEENNFLLKISQAQAKAILDTINLVLKKHPGTVLYDDFGLALVMYWEKRAQGDVLFSI